MGNVNLSSVAIEVISMQQALKELGNNHSGTCWLSPIILDWLISLHTLLSVEKANSAGLWWQDKYLKQIRCMERNG